MFFFAMHAYLEAIVFPSARLRGIFRVLQLATRLRCVLHLTPSIGVLQESQSSPLVAAWQITRACAYLGSPVWLEAHATCLIRRHLPSPQFTDYYQSSSRLNLRSKFMRNYSGKKYFPSGQTDQLRDRVCATVYWSYTQRFHDTWLYLWHVGTVLGHGADDTEAFKYMASVLVFVHWLARAYVSLLKSTWVSRNSNDKMAVYKGLDDSCIRYLLPGRYRVRVGSNPAIRVSADRPTDPTVYDRATHSALFYQETLVWTTSLDCC